MLGPPSEHVEFRHRILSKDDESIGESSSTEAVGVCIMYVLSPCISHAMWSGAGAG